MSTSRFNEQPTATRATSRPLITVDYVTSLEAAAEKTKMYITVLRGNIAIAEKQLAQMRGFLNTLECLW